MLSKTGIVSCFVFPFPHPCPKKKTAANRFPIGKIDGTYTWEVGAKVRAARVEDKVLRERERETERKRERERECARRSCRG